MGIFELTPSIRADTEAFNKALKELGWTRRQYNNKIKRLGISLSDKTSTKNFLNDALKKIGSSFRYKNIMQAPTKIATETRMGGVEPGRAGAPANEKICRDGAKIQKAAEKKFKNVTDQRKFFVDQMKKIYKIVPKSQILHIFKNILRGVKSFSPIGLGADLYMQMIEKNPELLNILNNKIDPSQVPMARKGGMMDINEMTRPLKGYNLGGPAGMTDLERTGYDRSKSGTWNTNDLMRDIGGDISFATKRAGRGMLDTVKGLFKEKQYEGGDNPYYMKFFDKYWKEGYDQEQIDMLWNTYKDDARNFKEIKKNTTPSRWEYDFDKREMYLPEGEFKGAKGGIVSLNHLTRRL